MIVVQSGYFGAPRLNPAPTDRSRKPDNFGPGRMHLLVEGLNYRGAPLSVRERVFLSGESLRRWLERLGARPVFARCDPNIANHGSG